MVGRFTAKGRGRSGRFRVMSLSLMLWDGLGDEDPTKGTGWEKGVRLAGLVKKEKVLLVLDGLEPLQYPPGAMGGRLKDQGVEALLKELAGGGGEGLCVVTTREKVVDLERTVGKATRVVELEDLDEEAGAAVLKEAGAEGGGAGGGGEGSGVD